jgi:hypothetical protein
MRLFGVSAMLALPFVFVPRSWMDSIHQSWLGMGPLPAEPIVGYLARSTSMFYFIMGGLMVLMSFDLRRYHPAIGYLLGTSLLFGVVLLGVDLYEGMPLHWVVCEGPCIMLLSVVMLMLWRGMDVKAETEVR